ncbi:hypothetical protein D3C84_1233040 [compost metagenome]
MRIRKLFARYKFRADGAETVATFCFHGRAVIALFRKAEFVDDGIASNMIQSLISTDSTRIFANHHPQSRPRLQ